MSEENLSEKIEKIDRLVYANEKAKLLGAKGITGDVIFIDDVKEFIKNVKDDIENAKDDDSEFYDNEGVIFISKGKVKEIINNRVGSKLKGEEKQNE